MYVLSNFFQFEGGLKVTSDVVNGIFALANRVNSTPAITEVCIVSITTVCVTFITPLPPPVPQEQATKFGNFLVTSKYTASLQDAAYLLSAARTLAENKVSLQHTC